MAQTSAVIKSNFKYDGQSEKMLEDLVKVARFEGYYDDAKPEFDALKSKLLHNVSRDLDINKRFIKSLIEDDIVAAYYYQAGSIQHGLQTDKQVEKAIELLNNNKFGGNYNIPHIITQIKVFLKNGTGLGKY